MLNFGLHATVRFDISFRHCVLEIFNTREGNLDISQIQKNS